MYSVYINNILMPVTPDKITQKFSGRSETIDLINGGEVTQIKKCGLAEITMECLIPWTEYPSAIYRNNTFRNQEYYLAKFKAMRNSKKPLTLKISRSTPDFKKLYDTNFKVILENLTVTEDVEEGMDLRVALEFKEYNWIGAESLQDLNGKKTVKKQSTRETKENASTYTVKKGDTLGSIAKKEMGSASRKTELYERNKDTIEKAAKKNGRKSSSKGWYLYAGTKLILPNTNNALDGKLGNIGYLDEKLGKIGYLEEGLDNFSDKKTDREDFRR